MERTWKLLYFGCVYRGCYKDPFLHSLLTISEASEVEFHGPNMFSSWDGNETL